MVSDGETLPYLVGQNTITPHVWLSRCDRVGQPDRMVVDLDPPPGEDFPAVRRAARQAGDLLRAIGLEPFAQVTGSKGIHVWTPLRRRADFEEVKEFSNLFAAVLAARHPDELTTEFRKAKRAGRILVDVLRNRYAQTAVPPYGVRPRPGAPVATPIEWDELSDSKLRPDRWNVKTVLRRLDAKGDPWTDIGSAARGKGGGGGSGGGGGPERRGRGRTTRAASPGDCGGPHNTSRVPTARSTRRRTCAYCRSAARRPGTRRRSGRARAGPCRAAPVEPPGHRRGEVCGREREGVPFASVFCMGSGARAIPTRPGREVWGSLC